MLFVLIASCLKMDELKANVAGFHESVTIVTSNQFQPGFQQVHHLHLDTCVRSVFYCYNHNLQISHVHQGIYLITSQTFRVFRTQLSTLLAGPISSCDTFPLITFPPIEYLCFRENEHQPLRTFVITAQSYYHQGQLFLSHVLPREFRVISGQLQRDNFLYEGVVFHIQPHCRDPKTLIVSYGHNYFQHVANSFLRRIIHYEIQSHSHFRCSQSRLHCSHGSHRACRVISPRGVGQVQCDPHSGAIYVCYDV